VAYDDSGQTGLRDTDRTTQPSVFGPYDKIYLANRLGIRNEANTHHQYFVGAPSLTADRYLTLPDYDGNDTVVGRASADTLAGVKTINNYMVFMSQTAPSAPDSGTIRLYAKDNGSGTIELFYKNSAGSERNLSTGGGGGGGGGASYLDDLIDVAISGVTNNQFLRYNSGSGLWENQTVTVTHTMLSTTHTDTVADTVVLGDVIYGNSTPAWQRLAGNTTTTKKFLAQTGNGTISAAPTWDSTVIHNAQDNTFGAHYFDVTRIAAPGNPAANDGRFYVKQIDANNDGFFVLLKRNGSFTEVQIV